jgi:hypothetical protein
VIKVHDNGLAYEYKGVERGEALEIISITLHLPAGYEHVDAPTLRSVFRWPAAGGSPRPEAQAEMEELHRRAALSSPLPREPLGPPANGLTDDFLRSVAAGYQEHTARTHKPNIALAEESGVPVGTVRRWVVEARRRGFLPPGERGRAT